MTHLANRNRRKKQFIFATLFVSLLVVVGVLTHLYRQSIASRNEAVAQTNRAEASKVLAIARAIPDLDPSSKLAYAIASLEFADSAQARRFALQALSEGPPAHLMEFGRHTAMEMSPDGKWIAAGRLDGGLDLLAENATTPISLQEAAPVGYVQWKPQFTPDSKLVIWTWRGDTRLVKVWSLSDRKVVRTFQLEGLTMCLVRNGKAFLITDTSGRLDSPMAWGPSVARIWNVNREDPEIIGQLELRGNWKSFDIDSNGQWIAYAKDTSAYARRLDPSGIRTEKLVGRHGSETFMVRFHPNGNQLAVVDTSGEIRLWPLEGNAKNPVRTIAAGINAATPPPFFAPDGRYLFVAQAGGIARWDLTADGAEPLLFRAPDAGASGFIDRKNITFVSHGISTLAEMGHPYIYRNKGSNVRFTPDGKSLISSNGSVTIWNLPGENRIPARTLWSDKERISSAIDVDPSGKYVFAATDLGTRLISIPDGKDIPLKGISQSYNPVDCHNVAFSPDGKTVAVIGDAGIEIWDVPSGKSRMLEPSKGKFCASLKYSPDGTLFSGCDGAVYRWNLKDDSAEILIRGKGNWVADVATSINGQYLAAVFFTAKNIYDFGNATSELVLYDFKKGSASPIDSHGNRVFCVAFDPVASKLISGDVDGIVRVGPVTGENPHLLLGHERGIGDIAVHPDGDRIATSDGTVRLWRMPQGKPLDSLPHREFLDHLRTLTNVRTIPDPTTPVGYRIQHEPFATEGKQ